MVFSSTIFLFLFLPVTLAVYFLSPKKVKNIVLLLFSLLFYTWGEDKVVLILLASSLTDFSCGILIENGKRKLGLGISIFFNLSILCIFKYLNFTFDNIKFLFDLINLNPSFINGIPEIALPIGISFYTFQTMSYTIDVYRGTVKANRNLIDFATYVCLFPQLVAGPIVRYSDIHKQLAKRKITLDSFTIGIERFIVGLAKKVLIANTFAAVADDIFNQQITDLSTPYAWLGIIAYSIQIYFDFSGYSDMAIGLGKMFGFDFPENFNYPYISKSIKEFWRRWHITLSSWFRDYVYISLGGNRKGNKRTYINLFLVFFVTGLWHGSSWNFVIWGLFHGLFIVFERMGFDKKLKQLWKPLQHSYTLLVVVVGWVFFRADNFNDAVIYLGKMFSFSKGNLTLNSYISYFHLNIHLVLASFFAILFSMPIYNTFVKRTTNLNLKWLHFSSLVLLFIITIIYLNADTYNPFIYFRF